MLDTINGRGLVEHAVVLDEATGTAGRFGVSGTGPMPVIVPAIGTTGRQAEALITTALYVALLDK
jgi:hypothetical protein